jgi:hypothetical protein
MGVGIEESGADPDGRGGGDLGDLPDLPPLHGDPGSSDLEIPAKECMPGHLEVGLHGS